MKEPFHVVLTDSKAEKYFGTTSFQSLIGKQITYNDSLYLIVSGIVKQYPQNSDFIFSDFISSATIQSSFLKDKFDLQKWQRWNKISQTFVKLTSGETPLQFQKQTSDVAKKIWTGLAAVLIALFTVSFQAIKAAIANPVKNLRTE